MNFNILKYYSNKNLKINNLVILCIEILNYHHLELQIS